VKAVSAGSRRFEAVAVVSSLEGLTYPCGACRQFLSEFGHDMMVVVEGRKGEIRRHRLADLLPETFILKE
jgi:cytidine deaminase